MRDRAAAAAYGKALSSPRARLVLLEMPLAWLPLPFHLVPYAVGERTTARPLLDAVGRHDLILIDRGFWGAGLFGRIATVDESGRVLEPGLDHRRRAIEDLLYCLERLGVKDLKTSFPGDHAAEFKRIDAERAKRKQESPALRSFVEPLGSDTKKKTPDR